MNSTISISGSSISISSLTASATQVTFDNTKLNLTLISTRITKKLYSPNELTVDIQVSPESGKTDKPDVQSISNYFLDAQISLWLSKESDKMVENFQIHEVEPNYSSTENCSITLRAYSWDKLLTYDKYCETWVSKCLGQDILVEKVKNTISLEGHLMTDFIDNNINNLHHLSYSNKSKEKIQPYLVQYNESFYDMLRRTAYRCGEFLFFEDAKLHLGVNMDNPVETTVTPVQITSRLVHRSNRAITPQHRAYQTEAAGIFGTKDYYHMSTAAEDYFDKYSKDPSTKDKQFGKWPNKVAGYLSLALTQYSLPDMILKTGTKIASDQANAAIAAIKTNKEYNGLYFPANMSNNEHCLNQDYYPFICSNTDGQITTEFYFENQQESISAKNQEICVKLSSSETTTIKLGQLITINSNKYIVTEVFREEEASDSDHTNYLLHAIAYDASKPNIYPPLQEDIPLIREAESQVAYVVNTDDPVRNGRVRIKFPWQKESEEASPWIRTSNPMAAKGCGIHFELSEGEEVIVNFTQGNMEAPYVTGSLYNKDATVRLNKIVTAIKKEPLRSISSSNGHAITFSDPQTEDGNLFFNSFAPIMTVIGQQKCENEVENSFQKDEGNKLVDSDPNDLKKAKQDLAKKEQELFKKYNKNKKPGSGDEEAAIAAIRWKKEKDMMLQFYQEAAAKSSYLGIKDMIPAKIWKNKQFDKQVEIDKSYNPNDETIKVLWEKLSGDTNLDKIAAATKDLAAKIQEGKETPDENPADENTEDGKKKNKLKKLYKFYLKAVAITFSKEDLKIDTDYEKNVFFYLHRQEIIKGVKHLANVTEAGLTSTDDQDLKKDGSTDVYQKAEKENPTIYRSDCTLDVIYYVPRVEYDESQDYDEMKNDCKNLLDKLNFRIKAIEELLKDLIIPDDTLQSPSDAFNDYTKSLEEFKTKKAESNSLTSQLKTTTGEYHSGGITLSDSLGLYKISMSAHDRNISIASPLGDINLNAFTGITINAPAGDIKIKGKNITLEAGNNLKLISGINKKDGILEGKKGLLNSVVGGLAGSAVAIGTSALAEATGFTGLVDLSALRVVFECLIKPVEGTLQIHSGNNLILESGDKKAALPVTNLNKGGNKNIAKRDRAMALAAVLTLLQNAKRNYENIANVRNFDSSHIVSQLNKTINDVSVLSKIKFPAQNNNTAKTLLEQIINDNKTQKKAKKYQIKDIYEKTEGENLLEDPDWKKALKVLVGLMNTFARQVVNYYTAVNAMNLDVTETLDAAGISGENNAIKSYFDTNNKEITVNDDATLTLSTYANKTDDDLKNALFLLATAMTKSKGSDSSAIFQSLLGNINKLPVAEYVDPLGNTMPNNCPGNADAWNVFIDNLQAPKENPAAAIGQDILNDVVGKLVGDAWGTIQGIIDDINGLTAERTGKIILANSKEQTYVLGDNGVFDRQGNANLDGLKYALKKAYPRPQENLEGQ